MTLPSLSLFICVCVSALFQGKVVPKSGHSARKEAEKETGEHEVDDRSGWLSGPASSFLNILSTANSVKTAKEQRGSSLDKVRGGDAKDPARIAFAEVMNAMTKVAKSELSSLFMFGSEATQPDISLVIDLMLKAQTPVTPSQGTTLRHRIYMLESMIWNIYEKYHRASCDWDSCNAVVGEDASQLSPQDCCEFCNYLNEGKGDTQVSTGTARRTAAVITYKGNIDTFTDAYNSMQEFHSMKPPRDEFPVNVDMVKHPWCTLVFFELRVAGKIPLDEELPPIESFRQELEEELPRIMLRVSEAWRSCSKKMGRYEKDSSGKHHGLRQYVSLKCMVEQSALHDQSDVSLMDMGQTVEQMHVFEGSVETKCGKADKPCGTVPGAPPGREAGEPCKNFGLHYCCLNSKDRRPGDSVADNNHGKRMEPGNFCAATSGECDELANAKVQDSILQWNVLAHGLHSDGFLAGDTSGRPAEGPAYQFLMRLADAKKDPTLARAKAWMAKFKEFKEVEGGTAEGRCTTGTWNQSGTQILEGPGDTCKYPAPKSVGECKKNYKTPAGAVCETFQKEPAKCTHEGVACYREPPKTQDDCKETVNKKGQPCGMFFPGFKQGKFLNHMGEIIDLQKCQTGATGAEDCIRLCGEGCGAGTQCHTPGWCDKDNTDHAKELVNLIKKPFMAAGMATEDTPMDFEERMRTTEAYIGRIVTELEPGIITLQELDQIEIFQKALKDYTHTRESPQCKPLPTFENAVYNTAKLEAGETLPTKFSEAIYESKKCEENSQDQTAGCCVAYATKMGSNAAKQSKAPREHKRDDGVAIFWRIDRYTAKTITKHRYNLDADVKNDFKNGFALNVILEKKGGQFVSVWTAHFASGETDKAEKERHTQADRILNLIEKQQEQNPEMKVIFAGDLNSDVFYKDVDGTNTWKKIWAKLGYSVWDHGGAQNKCSVAKIRGLRSNQPGKIGELRLEAIDHIFSNKGVHLEEAAESMFQADETQRKLIMDFNGKTPSGEGDAEKLSDEFKKACEETNVFQKLLPRGANPSDHLPVFARIDD